MRIDDQQREVVESQSKNILCIAGPGSGKTRTLVERVAYLIEQRKVSSHELVLFTFTRNAAQEMRKRIEARIGISAHKVQIGTFHSIALNLLHRFGDLIGYKADHITVYGSFEEEYLLRECAIDLGIYRRKSWMPPKKKVSKVLNDYYFRGEEPGEDNPCRIIFNEFIARCKENQSLTFGGLLVGFKLLLPHITKYLNWKHVMIDEAHDNNLIQWDLVLEIQRRCNASLFVVSDLDQAIYHFRGAFPQWILENQDQFDIYRIENNYRSTPQIVAASNRLIEHNKERIEKTMVATREDGDNLAKITEADSTRLADFIHYITEKDTPSGSIVVLSRIHALLEKLSQGLNEKGIPNKKIGRKTQLVNSEEFRRFHAFLKLIINPFDNFSFLLIRDIIGVTKTGYGLLRLHAAKTGKSHFQAFMELSGLPDWREFFRKASHYDMEGLMYKMSRMNFGCDMSHVIEFIDSWCADNSGIKDTACDEGPLLKYLSWLAMWDMQDEVGEEEENCIKLMTSHSSKGLEFPVVIIAGANEGIMPSKQSIKSGDIEEERRIFYVACTRAKDTLIITSRPETEENPQSRFIKELGDCPAFE